MFLFWKLEATNLLENIIDKYKQKQWDFKNSAPSLVLVSNLDTRNALKYFKQ